MPEVRNCRRCGAMFNYIGDSPICPNCRKKDDEDFKLVRDYIYDNPRATIYEVSTALGISVSRIKGYLREGRLEIVGSESNLFLACENCGKAIKSGRLCMECTQQLSRELSTITTSSPKSNSEEKPLDEKRKGVEIRYLNKK